MIAKLQQEGWNIKPKVLEELGGSNGGASLEQVKSALLNVDLREVGVAAFPENVNRAGKLNLKGNYIVQLVSVDDVSRPPQAEGGGKGSHPRLLRVRLTDGSVTVTAAELRPLSAAAGLPGGQTGLAPGTKCKLTDATVRAGVVMVEGKMLTVLGGRVEALAEEWEAQQKYMGLARPAEGGLAPPPFEPFDCSRRGAPHTSAGKRGGRATTESFAGSQGPQEGPEGSSNLTARQRPNLPPKRGKAEGGINSTSASMSVPASPPPGLGPSRPQQLQAPASSSRVQMVSAPVGKEGRDPRGGPAERGQQESGAQKSAVAVKSEVVGHNKEASRNKLLGMLGESSTRGRGERGSGRRGGRRGRGGREEDEDDTGITLQEWEEKKKAAAASASRGPSGGGGAGGPSSAQTSTMSEDERLARELQRQFDLGIDPPLQGIAPAGADQWARHITPSGHYYFHNTLTGVTQWEPPPPGSLDKTVQYQAYRRSDPGNLQKEILNNMFVKSSRDCEIESEGSGFRGRGRGKGRGRSRGQRG